ncbi:cytochrome P450 [Melanomma pulvis-pyrius CBS 109.77]|uniref:Cytochrome P450 n=1 Tax=Melanomma pulvis-pyrius CBS 109.77 TaxID=1314802 RepID=A0A6A6X166_9PLEO|nr:cytochrome P450 [Melanomma pulvis-pyrius CBS 109.77]
MYRIFVGDMDMVQRRLHERYGPIIRIAPNEVSTAELSSIPKIYRNQRPLSKTDFYPVWGGTEISKQPDTFTCTDERVHSNYRRIVNPVYTLSNVLKSENYINRCSSLFIQRLGEHADCKEVIDLGTWLQMYAFDVIGEIFFGNMFGFLEKSEDHGAFIASLDALMPVLCISAIAPWYMRPFIMASAIVVPAALKAVKAVDGIRKAAVEAAGKRKKEIDDGVAHRNDMLQQLFDIVREKGEKVNFTDKEATLEAWVAMFAGSDTTAVAFRSTFYYLMKNPEALAKAHAEIDAAIATGSLSSPIKYSQTTTKLPYVCASIKEAMRLHPSVGLSIQRHAPAEGIELAGKRIPNGYRIGMNPAVVHYDKDVFGQDADKFRPERWLVSVDEWKAMDRNLLTFGAGTRTCIGKNISLIELHTLVPEVLRHFNLTMAHDRPWTTSNRWFHKQTDVIVKVTRRHSNVKSVVPQ